jgi:hypothetical protein
MRTLLFVLCLSLGASHAATDPLAYFRDLAETRNYTLGRPVSPKLTPDGQTVIYLRGGPRDRDRSSPYWRRHSWRKPSSLRDPA